jgi:hypothetical protein
MIHKTCQPLQRDEYFESSLNAKCNAETDSTVIPAFVSQLVWTDGNPASFHSNFQRPALHVRTFDVLSDDHW